MKRIFFVLLTALLFFASVACAKARHYRDDLTGMELSEQALHISKAPSDYALADVHFLDDYFEIPEYVTDHAIHFSSDGNNLNELGIFHVEDGRTAEMKQTLQDYLSNSLSKNHDWYQSYIPDEIPKLRDAEVRTFGNYVVYAIFDRENRAAVFERVEQALAMDS